MPEPLLPSYIDVNAIKSQALTQDASFSQAADAWNNDAVMRAAQSQEGAQTALANYGRQMQNVIEWYKTQNTAAQTALKSASSDSTDYTILFKNQKAELEALRQKVETERELSKVRQEQVAALEGRDEANYHTSWMGLTRPLKEESRTGLLVAAGFFGVLLLACITYIIRIRYQASNGFSFFRGGMWALSSLKKGRYSN